MTDETSYAPDSPFCRLLDTKYDPDREQEAIDILNAHPELATLSWPGPDDHGRPFIKGSTALHYAANDGKLRLVARLIELGADVNACGASWYRSVLSWAANNACVETIRYLLDHGAHPTSLDAMYAAAWGGSGCGAGQEAEYAMTLRILVEAGADKNDRRNENQQTPLAIALDSGNTGAIDFLRSIDAQF